MKRAFVVLALATSLAEAQVSGATWKLGPQLLSIGSESDTNSQFAGIVHVMLMLDSGVVVANGGSKELRFFDKAGRFLRRSGREGSGPGEYRELGKVFRYQGDSIGIYDGWNRRLSVVSANGTFGRAVNIARPPGATGSPTPVGSFDNADFVTFVATPPTPGVGQEKGAFHRITATWFRHSASGAYVATLGRSPAGELFLELADGMVVNWAPPFQRVHRFAVSRDRVFAGDGTDANVVVLPRDGAVSTIRVRSAQSLDLTPSDIAAFRQQQLDRAPNTQQRGQLEKSFAKTPSPTTMPAFANLRVDSDGAVWIQEYPRPGTTTNRWQIVSGNVSAILEVPAAFTITEIRGDRVAGIWRDENDVETVRVFRIRR
jgi:hypothetical protein